MQPRRSTNPAARPAAETLPLLRVVIAREGGATSSFEFFQPIISFGRAPTADVRLEAENISRLHCTLELRADGIWVRDLGSLNGVYMDGERVQHAMLDSKSVVTVGPFRFRARQEGELPPSRFPTPPPPANDEWTRPGMSADRVPQAPEILRSKTRLDVPAAVPASTPVQAPSFARAPVSAPAPVIAPAPAAERTPKSRVARTPQERPVRMGDVCVACHDGQALVWGDGLRCRSCWGDGAARPRIVRVGELCPCCHQGSMLKWENGLRCRNCKNRGQSTRQAQPAMGKFRPGSKCPSCAERPLLTWKGSVRCHGCGQGYR